MRGKYSRERERQQRQRKTHRLDKPELKKTSVIGAQRVTSRTPGGGGEQAEEECGF